MAHEKSAFNRKGGADAAQNSDALTQKRTADPCPQKKEKKKNTCPHFIPMSFVAIRRQDRWGDERARRVAKRRTHNNAHAVAITLVTEIRYARDFLIINEGGSTLEKCCLVRLVWDLCHYDGYPPMASRASACTACTTLN